MTYEDKEALVAEAMDLIDSSMVAEAAQIFESILKIYPNEESVYFDLADCYRSMEDYDNAIVYFEKVVANPDNNDIDYAHMMLGICYLTSAELNNYDEDMIKQAIIHYEKGLDFDEILNPEILNKTLFDLGLAYVYLESYKKAIEYMEKVLHLDPQNFLALSRLGSMYSKTGNVPKGIEYTKKALLLDASDPISFYTLGQMYSEINNFDQSIEAYSKAIEINPNYSEAYTNMSDSYLKLGEYDKALEYGFKASEIEPNDFYALSNVAEAYENTGDIENARKYYNNVLEISPDFKDAADGLKRLQK